MARPVCSVAGSSAGMTSSFVPTAVMKHFEALDSHASPPPDIIAGLQGFASHLPKNGAAAEHAPTCEFLIRL